MKLFLENQTASPLAYLSGNVTVPASSTTEVLLINYQYALATDGQLRNDLITNKVYLTDGVNAYAGNDGIEYLKYIFDNLSLNSNTGDITAQDEAVTLYLGPDSVATVNVTGTWTGTLMFEASNDPSAASFPFTTLAYPVPSGAPATTTITNGSFVVYVGGYTAVRVRSAAVMTGTASVSLMASTGTNITAGSQIVSQGAPNIYENAWPIVMGQKLDTNNSITVTSAQASPGNPWIGGWTQTRSVGFVRELILAASNVPSGLGGILTFEFSEDGINVTATNPRPIIDFAAPRDFDLLNTGEYFRIKFEPDRTMTGGESIFIRSTLRRQNDGGFARLLTQELEEQNASLVHNAAFIKAFDTYTGKSVNIRPTTNESLKVEDQSITITPSGSQFVEAIRDEISLKFTASKGDLAVASLVDLGSIGGSAAMDTSAGQAVFSTGVAAGNSCIKRSNKKLIYEPGHGIRGEQTIELDSMPIGDAYVEWGLASEDLTEGIGLGIDITGIYIWRRKGGIYQNKVYQSDWNSDKCDGLAPSLFKKGKEPQVLNPMKNNLYGFEFEWLGAAPIKYLIKSPSSDNITVHIEEFANNNSGSTLKDPELSLHVAIYNDTISGGEFTARMGSWRGGTYTSKIVLNGKDPNGVYGDFRVQGISDENTTSTPLAANASYVGKWFPWLEGYVQAGVTCISDTTGTLYIELTNELTPIEFTQDSVEDAEQHSYDPVMQALFKKHIPVNARYIRIRYVNGNAAQSTFGLNLAFFTTDPGTPLQTLDTLPNRHNSAGLVRAVLATPTPSGDDYQEIPISAEGNPKVHIAHIEDDVLIEPLDTASASQIIVGTVPVRIDPSPLANRRVVSVNVDGPSRVAIGHSSSITYNTGSIRARVGSTKVFGIDATVPLWAVAEDLGGVETVYKRDGASTSGTATNTNNALLSDDTYATIDAIGENVNVSGFTAGTTNELVSVKIGIEGKKQAGQTETVLWVDTVTGTAGNTGSVTSGTVIAGTEYFYTAAISRRNSSAAVTSVTGLGLIWSEVADIIGDAGQTRISLWKGTGTPTGNSTVVATFSKTATNSVIAVSSFNHVNLSDPIENFEALNTLSKTNSYSDSIVGTDKGMLLTSISMRERLHTVGSGATEVNETRTGTGSGAASLATNILALTATGATAYSGTFSGSVDWTLIALTLRPESAQNPVGTLSYTLSGVPQATSGNIVFNSTTDQITYVDVTSDRSWVFGDIANIAVNFECTDLSAATADVDHIFVEVTDTTGNVSRVCIWQGAKAVT